MLALLLGSGLVHGGPAPVITSFSGNGVISWNHPTNTVSQYRVEWTSDLSSGLWCDMALWPFPGIPTNTTMQVTVPMYYRIRSVTISANEMVYIPAGFFQMGNSMAAAEGDTTERPVHQAYVSAFFIDAYNVSLAKWSGVYTWATNHGYSFDNPGLAAATNYPVQFVNWFDCVKWCNARSEREGLIPAYYTSPAQTAIYRSGQCSISNNCVKWTAGGYRLPTEAEWEKAARGGLTGRRFPWGNVIDHALANYSGNPSNITYDAGYAGPDHQWNGNESPVNAFPPNGYGVYDMAGNAPQWCWDTHAWYDSQATQIDPRGPDIGGYRVVRGGLCYGAADSCRCAKRIGWDPAVYAAGWFSFRCAR